MIESTTNASPEAAPGSVSSSAYRARGADWAGRFALALFSTVVALGFCLVTGLIPGWGQWYSANFAYRRQTEAMLQGSFALDSDPRRLGYDMAWAEGGVQQVWGLGVPGWRLPFEWSPGCSATTHSRIVSPWPPLWLFSHTCCSGFWSSRRGRTRSCRSSGGPKHWPERCCLFCFRLFSRFAEPISTFTRRRKPTVSRRNRAVCLDALVCAPAQIDALCHLGCVRRARGFRAPNAVRLRPGFVIVAWLFTRRQGWQHARSLSGLGVFCAAGGLLFLTNASGSVPVSSLAISSMSTSSIR